MKNGMLPATTSSTRSLKCPARVKRAVPKGGVAWPTVIVAIFYICMPLMWPVCVALQVNPFPGLFFRPQRSGKFNRLFQVGDWIHEFLVYDFHLILEPLHLGRREFGDGSFALLQKKLD